MKRVTWLQALGLALICQTVSWGQTKTMLFDDFDDPGWKPDITTMYKHVGGLDLPMQIFLPKDRKNLTERRTTVLCIHGGAWSGYQGGDWRTWDGGIFAVHARYFAARGAVGVVFDYRNVARPDKDKNGFENGSSVFDLLADCRSAVRFLREHAAEYGIDPTRIVALGDSAGGHLAACLGTIDAFDNPGDDVSISGMANATILCNAIMDMTSPWISYMPETPRAWEQAKPLSREERARRISPLFNASAKSTPSLVMQGLRDTIVVPEQSFTFQRRMQAAGARCELLTLPDAMHAFIVPGYRGSYADWVTAMRAADSFLVSLGYLHGDPLISALPPVPKERRQAARFAFATPPVDGCESSIDDKACLKIAASADGVVDDAEQGKVLQVKTYRAGLYGICRNMGVTSTITLWINPSRFGGVLASRTCGFGGDIWGYALAMDNSGKLNLKVGSTQTVQASEVPGIQIGRWNHVIASIDREHAEVYLNGQSVVKVAYPPITLVGNRLSIAGNYAGLLSDLRLYTGAMTPTEILSASGDAH